MNYCGKKLRIFEAHTRYGDKKIAIVTETYRNNNTLALQTILKNWEPYATLTVNLPAPDSFLADKTHAYVDTNNQPWAPDFLEKNGLAEPTGVMGRSGYCEYPLYHFFLDKLNA